mmetsp:Transcript_3696/g.6295  ORF Transcript_3696/g.6295 Transcript_3696/m.6295 type:complete len:202 (-) Transcript_3696:167-772(-)
MRLLEDGGLDAVGVEAHARVVPCLDTELGSLLAVEVQESELSGTAVLAVEEHNAAEQLILLLAGSRLGIRIDRGLLRFRIGSGPAGATHPLHVLSLEALAAPARELVLHQAGQLLRKVGLRAPGVDAGEEYARLLVEVAVLAVHLHLDHLVLHQNRFLKHHHLCKLDHRLSVSEVHKGVGLRATLLILVGLLLEDGVHLGD